MQYRAPDHRHQRPKRMRLGTKSCTECRRRKVRCTFISQGSVACQQCSLRKTVCRSQDDDCSTISSSSSISALSSSKNALGRSVELSQSAGQVANQNVPFQQRSPTLSATNYPDLSGTEASEAFESGGENNEDYDTVDVPLGDVPLVRYLQNSLSIEPSASPQPNSLHLSRPLLRAHIAQLIPPHSTLLQIFQATSRVWTVWPLSPSTPSTGAVDHELPTSIPSAVEFLKETLRSTEPSVVAKGLLWLCLCLQQLPRTFERTSNYQLPISIARLRSKYIDEVDYLVFQCTSLHAVGDITLLEVYILQYEFFITMGRPRRAWRSVRAGINDAMALGLHRPGQQSRRKNMIWNCLWHEDRHLSSFLGLPYAVPEYLLPNVENDDSDIPLEQRLLRRIGILCGRIVDRDQQQQQNLQREASYSTTIGIMEDIDRLKEMIPPLWFTAEVVDSSSSLPFGRRFWRAATPLFFHLITNMLHLPYVTLASRDKKYEYSRSTAFESAEAIIHAYHNLRNLVEASFNCDLLDFIAFSAGIILAADLTSRTSLRTDGDSERVWTLISELARRMRRTAEALNCAVAGQSAEVLDHLCAARHAPSTEAVRFETVIPFFGRIRIKRPSNNNIGVPPQPEIAPVQEQTQGIMEYDQQAFNFRFPCEFQSVDELAGEWSSEMDFSMYDWYVPSGVL